MDPYKQVKMSKIRRHVVKECSDPYLDAETIPLASILVTSRIELEVDHSISEGDRQFVRMSCLTSFCQPLLSFLSKPARIDATPVLYKKSREKYLKKSISLGNRRDGCISQERG